jgi:antitoxin component of MazEF toxin-antitoxin module
MEIRKVIQKGSSLYIYLPKEFMNDLKISKGDNVVVSKVKDTIVIKKLRIDND